jgi:hypothetical protein
VRTLRCASALAGLLLALTAPAALASQDSVTGTGTHFGALPPYPPIQVHVNAFADATGVDAGGKLISDMRNATAPGKYEGRVTCLTTYYSILGQQATVGIEIVDASDPAFVGMGQLWNFADGGGGPDVIDRIAGYPLTATPPTECPLLTFAVPVVSGNYVIHDAVTSAPGP